MGGVADREPQRRSRLRARLSTVAHLFVYTDGLTEARGEGRTRFGETRLHEHLETSVGVGAGSDEIVESLIRMVDEFQIGGSTDDVTIVALARSAGPDRHTDGVPEDADRRFPLSDRRRQVHSAVGSVANHDWDRGGVARHDLSVRTASAG